ncbi:MAG: extracellular solute-binding protein [Candidatus Omnitrophica bacterium]|nr:extracellular solute-binding protein [Candidatus Omnitrophota bacterium]
MRRRLWVLGLLWLVQGCSRPSSSQTQLTMWLVGSEAQAKTINELALPFTQRTGVRVQCEAISWGEAHSKYLTAVAGGVQPDIGTMGLTWGAEFGRRGALVNLGEAFPQDIQAIRRETFPGLWDSVQQGGQVYGIPLDLTLQLLYYRTDLIPKLPQTWEELTALLVQLRNDDRRMLIDWGSLSWIGYAPFLWQAGGDFYTPDQAMPAVDSPQAVRALEFFRDLYTRYDVPKTSIPVEQGLRTGEFPLALSGNWKIVSLTSGVKDIAGRWAVGVLPAGPTGRRTSFLGGRVISVFANSPHRDDAWRFVRYLFDPAVQVKLYETAMLTQDAYLPPNMSTWEILPMDAAMKSVLIQQAQDAKGPPSVPGWNESTSLVESAIQRVILHEADPQAALREAAKHMVRQLEQTKREGG